MKIHVTPCAHGPDAWTHQVSVLRELHQRSTPRLHDWVETPEEADLILLTNVLQPEGYALADHPLPRRFPEKCFVVSEQWQPPFLHAGIYANAPRLPFWRGRFRTGSYALYHPDFHNPHIEAHTAADSLPPEKRDLLFSFVGRNCHPIRERLFNTRFTRPDILVEDSSTFNAFTHDHADKAPAHRRYYDLSLRSKFILCPRGCGPNSIRLFEALKLGIAPIIVSDAWIPVEGPDWSSFALFIRESEVDQLERRVAEIEPDFLQRGIAARAAHDTYFAPERYFNYLVNAASSIQSSRVIPERFFLALRPVGSLCRRFKSRFSRS